MPMKAFIYHIRYPEHSNIIDHGYIGLTNNCARREAEHWAALTLNSHKNHKLQQAFNERPDDIKFSIYKEFSNRSEASLLEETLRPIKNIGWNIAVGGEKEYGDRFKKKTFNIENDCMDERLLGDKLNFIESNFSVPHIIFRYLFSPFINSFRKAKQSVVMGNLLEEDYAFIDTNIPQLTAEITEESWTTFPSISLGKWGMVPHLLTSVALALNVHLKQQTLTIESKFAFFRVMSKVIDQILVNGSLYQFNRVDAFIVDMILIDFFTLQYELGVPSVQFTST